MKIDFLGVAEVPPAPGDGEARPAVKITAGAPTLEDRTTFSSGDSTAAALTAQALSGGDARAAKVDALRQAVSRGEYAVDPSAVADAILGQGK